MEKLKRMKDVSERYGNIIIMKFVEQYKDREMAHILYKYS